MRTPEDWMTLALGNALLALNQGWIPVGAVFERDQKILAHGTKTGITHERFDHAELNACHLALPREGGGRDLEGVTVYATLEPCALCMSALMTARVSHIVFGLEDPYGGGSFILRSLELPPRFTKQRPTLQGGVLREESKGLLRTYFLKNNGRRAWGDPDNALVRLALSE